MNIPHQEPSLSGDFMEGEGSFFRAHHRTVLETLSKEQFDAFCKLKNDEDRLQFVYNLDKTHKMEIPKAKKKKDGQSGLKYKNVGNNFFSKGKYEQAARTYGIGILECPNDEGVLLSTLYANRSAALYHLEEHFKCLQDLNLALALPYPEKLHHKAFERQARCHLAINEIAKAMTDFKKALAALDKSDIDTQARQKKEFDFSIMIKCLDKTLQSGVKQKKLLPSIEKLPDVPGLPTENKKFPSASNSVKIVSEQDSGRFAIANNDIEPGDTLLVEPAYCSTLLFENAKTHCQNCFIRVAYPIPCPNCPNIVFCSLKCRKNAMNSFHKVECTFMECLWTSGASIVCCLAMRLITQKGLQYFIDLKPKLSQPANENDTYDITNYRTVYNLCRHETERTPADFFQRATMSTILLRLLQGADFFNTKPTRVLTEEEKYIGGLILHNLQFLQFNAHEIAELQYDVDFPGELEMAKSQFIGGGVFPTLALFNHSCDPGIVRYFSGSKVIVKSVKPIREGEIIAENYGPIYTQVKREERQMELSERYWFQCKCIPCVENWPLFENMPANILPFRCITTKKCPGVFKVNVNTNEFMFPCPKCLEKICIFGSLRSLNDTEAMFTKGEGLIRNKNFVEALKTFIKIQKILDGILKAPFKDYCLCQQKIRSCMLTFGNSFQKSVKTVND